LRRAGNLRQDFRVYLLAARQVATDGAFMDTEIGGGLFRIAMSNLLIARSITAAPRCRDGSSTNKDRLTPHMVIGPLGVGQFLAVEVFFDLPEFGMFGVAPHRLSFVFNTSFELPAPKGRERRVIVRMESLLRKAIRETSPPRPPNRKGDSGY
jgi:hypothetical protein